MIKYPDGRKSADAVKKETSFSHRGMNLEDDINHTNQYYLDTGKAVVYKKPTPITIVNVDYRSRQTAKITEAYFQIPSTTDYNGVYRGFYLDFEAKETHSRTAFPLSSIHAHQLNHLKRVIEQKGIAFLLVRFTQYDETFFVLAADFLDEISHSERKSVRYEWFREHGYLIPYNYVVRIDYLHVIDSLMNGGRL